MSARLIRLDDVPAFEEMRGISLSEIKDDLRSAVKELHEINDIEPFIRAILSDRAATPHGPVEIADILTHRISLNDSDGLAAFILKGRSFRTVRSRDVSHQIYRLEKIDGLHFAVLGATGTVLDQVKEQFSSTCMRLDIAYSFIDIDDFARLFWAYGFLCPRDGSRIVGGRCHCGYAPSHSVLNILQSEALAELTNTRRLKQTSALVILPPGSGKTRIAAKDAKAAAAQTVLYVAHTHEILDVAFAEFSATYGREKVARLSSKTEAMDKQVTLTTIQHLRNNLDLLDNAHIDYVVIDEFHHAATKTYRQVVDALDYDFMLGLTATPFRGDRQDIASLCGGNIVVNYELRSGVEIGILTPYYYFGCFDYIDYSNMPINAGHFSIRDLERKLIIRERHQAIVRKWKERAEGKPTLAFCCSHRHADKLSQEFVRQGIPAASYISSTKPDERSKLISLLRVGEIKVLCVVDILNEGADIPFVECLLFVRPTESKRIFLQQLGRGLRKYVGKSHCVVIDFIGNFRNAYRVVEYHGLRPDETDERGASLSGSRTVREVLDVPLGCRVEFEEKVLDIFANQTLDPRNATRGNIGRILIYQYERLTRRLGRSPTKKDVDRSLLLGSWFYRRVFGSWERFAALMSARG